MSDCRDAEDVPDVQAWFRDDGMDGADGNGPERETHCRRSHVAAHGVGVPFFLAAARPRGCKGWGWLLAARAPAVDRPGVGRVDYGSDRFYMGDLDQRGLPHGYGAAVTIGRGANAAASGDAPRWEGRPVLWWYEGYWHHGARQGEGLKVCAQRSVAMDGHWHGDRFDGRGVLTYGRGRWTLASDGTGSGRWSGGDTWRFDGEWRNGERHGPGTLTIEGLAEPVRSVWANGTMAAADGTREPTSDEARAVSYHFQPGHRRTRSHPQGDRPLHPF